MSFIASRLGTISGWFFRRERSRVSPGSADRGLSLLMNAVIFSWPTLKLFSSVWSQGAVMTARFIRPLLSRSMSSSLFPSMILNLISGYLPINDSIHLDAMSGAEPSTRPMEIVPFISFPISLTSSEALSDRLRISFARL